MNGRQTLREREELLARIAYGAEAAQLLEAPLPERAALVVLPPVAWIDNPTVGRLHEALDPRLPHQINWDGPRVLLVDEDRTLDWTATGWGSTHRGVTRVLVTSNAPPHIASASDGVPADQVEVTSQSQRALARALRHLVNDGDTAYAQMLTSTRVWCARQLERAMSRVAAELSSPGRLLDSDDTDAAIDELQLGTNQTAGTVIRGITLYTSTRERPPVDFGYWMSQTLCRDAEQIVRRRIDDPHIGPALRRHAQRNPDLDRDQLLESFNEGRVDRVGAKRAAKALQPIDVPRYVDVTPDIVVDVFFDPVSSQVVWEQSA